MSLESSPLELIGFAGAPRSVSATVLTSCAFSALSRCTRMVASGFRGCSRPNSTKICQEWTYASPVEICLRSFEGILCHKAYHWNAQATWWFSETSTGGPARCGRIKGWKSLAVLSCCTNLHVPRKDVPIVCNPYKRASRVVQEPHEHHKHVRGTSPCKCTHALRYGTARN